MYTQCPECGLAFRVTADVLKVAAGKVRCGGCAHAFNALDYLSEEMPEQKTAEPEAEPQLPELKPEPLNKDDGLPESISAEQSAALLKTLDQLAGSDIRIEDTGVEWMVLDEDEEPEQVDEILEDSPTPVDEFLTSTPEVVDSPEIFEESANAPAQTPVEELRFDDNTPLPEDFGFEDLSSDGADAAEPASEPEPEPQPAEPQPDITLSDPHEWTDILDEFEELAGEAARPLDAELDALLEQEEVLEEDEASDELEAASEIDSEATEIELADYDDDEVAIDELVDEEPVDDDTAIEDLDFDAEEEIVEEEPDEDVASDEDQIGDEHEHEDEDEDEDEELAALADDEQLDVIDDDPQLDLIEEPVVEEHDIESELAMVDEGEDQGDDDEAGSDAAQEHFVPEMSEEEQTVNMQIDQELFAIAVEDDDGFTSTMIIPEDHAEKASDESDDEDGDPEETESPAPQEEVGFETIIMEGAEVKSALEDEKRAADIAEAAELQEIARAAEAEAAKKAGSNRYGMIAGVVFLVIVLLIQVVHHSREALATNEVFNNTIGPIYRAIGKPLQPAWDITGWRFEATRGSAETETNGNTAETSETLTVYSRIGNDSADPLPYPLIRISLTDRFEEPLGSHILEPNDYLGNSMDPRKLVESGESFEAAITVASPSEEATSFRLDVCYRHSDRQLRCKDDNFK